MTIRRYRLRATNTFAAILVRNDDGKLLSRLGHDHVVRASEFTSTVAIDPDHPDQLGFALDFPVDSLVVDAPQDRQRVGLDGPVSDRDRSMTRENMLGKDQLHAARHGTIKLRINGAEPATEQQWRLHTSLTVQQERFDFDFPVAIELSPRLLVSGRVDIDHRDLGLTPYKAPMGTLRNRQDMTLIVDIDAVPL